MVDSKLQNNCTSCGELVNYPHEWLKCPAQIGVFCNHDCSNHYQNNLLARIEPHKPKNKCSIM
jgi:hypothetical protein